MNKKGKATLDICEQKLKVGKVLLMFTLLLLLPHCSKVSFNVIKYTIKEGKHSSGNKFNTLQNDVLAFSAKFSSSCLYDLQNDNQGDINKLYGFADCNDHHHTNSARFGWRCVNDKIEIHAYVYNNGQRVSKYLQTINVDNWYDFSIEISNNYYIFVTESGVTELPRTNHCEVGLYYMLYPYFGGDETAPHDMDIFLNTKY